MTSVPEAHGNRQEALATFPGDTSLSTVAGPSQATGPPPAPVPAPHHLLGLRVAAALVDVTLLAGLFVIVGLATGGTPAPTPGVFSWSVGAVAAGTWWIRFGEATVAGWWLALYLAVLLLYFFASEATTGQTVGKRLLGLRVVYGDGTRPSVAAIAGRTLLRLVDWLPLLYLVGFISVLVTGKRQQRLGDLAAWTQVGVARGLPVRRRHPVLASVLAGLAILGLSIRVTSGGTSPVATAGSSQACQAHGVSFHYPAGWHERSARMRVGGNGLLCQTALGIDPLDAIFISAYPLSGPVTPGNLTALTPFFTQQIKQLASRDGGALQAGPQRIRVGGLPALEFWASGLSYSGARIESTIVNAFDGRTTYEILCQHTPEHAAQVRLACSQVLRTFTVTSPA